MLDERDLFVIVIVIRIEIEMGSGGGKPKEEEQDGASVHSPCKPPPSSASSLPKVFHFIKSLFLPLFVVFFFIFIYIYIYILYVLHIL